MILSASYCQKILFIKDGMIHQEIRRENQSQEDFYRQILDILGKLGTIRRIAILLETFN